MADSTNNTLGAGASMTLQGDTTRRYAIQRLQRQQAAIGKQRKGVTVAVPTKQQLPKQGNY